MPPTGGAPERHAWMIAAIHHRPSARTTIAAGNAIPGSKVRAPRLIRPPPVTMTVTSTSTTAITGPAKVRAARGSPRYAWPRPGKMKLSNAATAPDRLDATGAP